MNNFLFSKVDADRTCENNEATGNDVFDDYLTVSDSLALPLVSYTASTTGRVYPMSLEIHVGDLVCVNGMFACFCHYLR